MNFNELKKERVYIKNGYRNCNFWTSTKKFSPNIFFDKNIVLKVFQFSYDMTFGSGGSHRKYRSGGSHQRRNGELFINTLQGKIAEFGVFQYFKENKINTNEPDLSTWDLGIWDSTDLIVNHKKINIKSTKSKGHLLLLETKDWDSNGNYIPNIDIDGGDYDYFVLSRIDPDGERIMKDNRFYLSDNVDIETLKNIILNIKWKFDIVGYIEKHDLIKIVNKKIIIKKNEYLNKWTPMDADNYYVQSGDMRNINHLLPDLRTNDT